MWQIVTVISFIYLQQVLSDFNDKKMAPTVERITESVELGEGPHWDVQTESLYFIDFPGKTIHKYTPKTKRHTKTLLERNVSLVIPVDGTKDKYLVAMVTELAIVTWDGVSERPSKVEKLAEVEKIPFIQINDGKADSTGRFWTGTYVANGDKNLEPKGTLYSLDSKTKQLKAHVQGIKLSNGMTWSPKYDKFYYIDSPTKKIDEFDYDINNGTISNRRTVFSLEKHGIPGVPDGQTVDTDGNLWVAIFDGARVIKIDPRRPETLLESIQLPAKQVTSVAFGGANLDELYVTTARILHKGELLTPPDHGATYKITGTGSRGFPGVRVKL